jgi:hypothetical protein
MPDVVTEQDIADLIIATNPSYKVGKFYDLAQEFVEYFVMPLWFKQDKVMVSSGHSIRETLMTRYATARNVGLTDLDQFNIIPHLKNFDVPWRRSTVNWTYDVREMLENKSPSMIVDEVEVRRHGARGGMANLMERNAWAAPASSTDDSAWWGVPYWITEGTTQGFTGGAPTGFTTKAGIDCSVVERFNNYYGEFSAYTKDDFVDLLAEAMYRVGFKNPIGLEDFRGKKGQTFRLYCGWPAKRAIEKIGEGQNENLGKDIVSMDGVITIKGNGIWPVDILEEDSDEPFFALNHDAFYPNFLKGDFMRETGPDPVPFQHNWRSVHTDVSGNYTCLNPSSCIRLHKV